MLGTGWWLSVRGTSGLVHTTHTHHPPDPLYPGLSSLRWEN